MSSLRLAASLLIFMSLCSRAQEGGSAFVRVLLANNPQVTGASDAEWQAEYKRRQTFTAILRSLFQQQQINPYTALFLREPKAGEFIKFGDSELLMPSYDELDRFDKHAQQIESAGEKFVLLHFFRPGVMVPGFVEVRSALFSTDGKFLDCVGYTVSTRSTSELSSRFVPESAGQPAHVEIAAGNQLRWARLFSKGKVHELREDIRDGKWERVPQRLRFAIEKGAFKRLD